MSFLRWALVLVPLIVLLGMISGRLGRSGSGNAWFQSLAKPAIMPPDAAFPIAWTILYVLMAVALALVVNARGARGRAAAIAAFVVQLALNLVWSPLFFAAHEVTLAFWWILAMLFAAAVTTWLFLKVRPLAALLMLPYLAWLIFAATLNFQIDRLNPDAESIAPDGASTQIAL